MKKTGFIILLILYSISGKIYGQPSWAENTKLTWEDFSGPVDDASPFAATTHSHIDYKYICKHDNNVYTLTFTITHTFNKAKSWAKPDGTTSDLLEHEQLHFDINELFARRLLLAFKQKTFTANFAEETKEIFSQVIKEAQGMNDKYDSETDHSKRRSKQKMWDATIREQLKITPSY